MGRRLVTLPGCKYGLAPVQINYFPKDGFTKSWETHAGTCAISNNILSGFTLEKMYATELEKGMYTLLKVCKEQPCELVEALMNTEYSPDAFDWSLEQEKNNYENMAEVEIAKAKYIMQTHSINGIGADYRDIDKGSEDDLGCWKSGQQRREKYKRNILKIIEYSQGLQNVELIHDDMLNYFDKFAADSGMFIYSDIPYTNNLRSKKLYKKDTKPLWHREFSEKLTAMTKDGRLKAKMMLCNYVSENMQSDVYCKALLKEGWTLYLIKDVHRPTVIKKDSKSRKKNKAVEAVYLNYQPINPIVGRDRIFTYKDVF